MTEELDYDDLSGAVDLDFDDLSAEVERPVSDGYKEPRSATNVIIIMFDDLGPDQLTKYDSAEGGNNQWAAGYNYPLTPNIDKIAEEGITYDWAYASPVCSPTRAQILTGRYPHIHFGHAGTGIGDVIQTGDSIRMLASQWPLGRLISSVNDWMRTGAFGKYHLAPEISDDGDPVTEARFGRYHGFLRNPHPSDNTTYHEYWKTDDPGTGPTTAWETGVFLSTDEYNDAAEFLAQQGAGGGFVLQWWAHSVHEDLDSIRNTAGPNGERMTDTFGYNQQEVDPADGHVAWRRMNAHVESIDFLIGLLDDDIPEEIRDNTLWIILGDNGSALRILTPSTDDFFGNGSEPPDVYDNTHCKGTGYEQGIRVPLIIGGGPTSAGDGPIPSAQQDSRSDQLVDIVDLYPTILDMTAPGWEEYLRAINKYDEIDGISLKPTFLGQRSERHFILSQRFEPLGAEVSDETDYIRASVNTNRWKLIIQMEDSVVQPEELYYLGGGEDYSGEFTADPLEQTDLIDRVVAGTEFHYGAWSEYNQLKAWFESNLTDIGIAPWIDLGQTPEGLSPPEIPEEPATPVPYGTIRWTSPLTSSLQGGLVSIGNTAQHVLAVGPGAATGELVDRLFVWSDDNPPTALFSASATYGAAVAAYGCDAAITGDAFASAGLFDVAGSGNPRPVLRAYTSSSTSPDWVWTGSDIAMTQWAWGVKCKDDGTKLAMAYYTHAVGLRCGVWPIGSSSYDTLKTIASTRGTKTRALAISGDCTVLVSYGSELRMSTIATGVSLFSATDATVGPFTSDEIAISADAAVVAFGSATKVMVYAAGAGTYAKDFEYELESADCKCTHVELSSDGAKLFATWTNTAEAVDVIEVVCIDVATEAEEFRYTIQTTGGNEVVNLSADSNGTDLVVTCTGGSSNEVQPLMLFQYRLGTWEPLRMLYDLEGSPVSARLASDSSRYAVVHPETYLSTDGAISLITVLF